jgi:hypothetical protein
MKGSGSMLGAAILTAVLGSHAAAAFLSSLLNNQVSYRLTLLGREPGSVIVTELAGPGPEYRCRNVVEAMRRDGRVLSIHLDQDTAMHAVSEGVRTTLDLRPTELRSLDVADLQQTDTTSVSDAAQAVTITDAPLALEEAPDSQPSFGGFASLYWAARHPTQAWRVLLPVQLDGYELSPRSPEGAAEDATLQALADERDVGADPAPIWLAHNTGG